MEWNGTEHDLPIYVYVCLIILRIMWTEQRGCRSEQKQSRADAVPRHPVAWALGGPGLRLTQEKRNLMRNVYLLASSVWSLISFATHSAYKLVLLIHHQLVQLWWYICKSAYQREPASGAIKFLGNIFFVTDQVCPDCTMGSMGICTTMVHSHQLFFRVIYLSPALLSTTRQISPPATPKQYGNKSFTNTITNVFFCWFAL
jgi:hypothetical protein